MFHFSNCSAESKYYDKSNKFVAGKMKDETGGIAIKEFVGLKPKMCSFLIDDRSEHKKAVGVNKNVISTIIHSEYKNVKPKMFETFDQQNSSVKWGLLARNHVGLFQIFNHVKTIKNH